MKKETTVSDYLNTRSRKGFASMSPEKRSAIARLGGIAAHAKGTAHQWTKEEAAVAGAKGGKASPRSKKGGLSA